jgi:hypothetical protein
MDDLTEEELRQIVSGAPNDWMEALKKKHPDWILQPIQSQPASSETGEQAGPIEGYTFYDPKKTKVGEDNFQRYDVSGKLLGEQKFKKPGNIWDLTKQAAADLGPILSFTPLAPLVRAISALSAAERGDILGALASGLPLADKIPGLDAATASTLKDIGKYASVGKAAQSGDWQQVLSAASQIPGVGTNIPQELKTVSDYASKAALLQRAAKGDISAIAALAKSSDAVPTKKFGDVAPEDLIEGFFAPGGEGYYASEDPGAYYGSDPSQEKYAEEDRLLGKYPAPAGDVEPAGPRTTMDPMELTRFLEANIDDPATIAELLDQYYPQTIGVTGTKETTPRSIRDIGTITKIDPSETLDIPAIPVPDLSVGLQPAVPGATKPGTKPATEQKGTDWAKLFALLSAMQQRPEEKEQDLTTSMFPKYGELAYGFSGETPYMRG